MEVLRLQVSVSLSSKKPFPRLPELLLIGCHEGRHVQCVRLDQVCHSCMLCGHLLVLPLPRRGRSFPFNQPNSVGIFTEAALIPISSPMVKRTKLFLTAYVHFAPFKSSTLCITHANLIHPLALLVSPLTTISPTRYRGVGNDIPRLAVKTLTDTSVQNCCKGDISAFQPSNMVGVPAVWEIILEGIVAIVNSGSPITKAIFNGAMYVPVLAQLAGTFILLSVRTVTGRLLH